MKQQIKIPLSVPKEKEKIYIKNFNLATRGTGKLMMFACDQKVEHLNDDFVGKNIPDEVADPEHYFKIANKANIGVLATQLGLIAKYGKDYPNINYLVKVNSKTNLLKKQYKDPFSNIWLHIDEIYNFKKQTKLNIVGVGYTIYFGSWYESDMFNQAAHLIYHAHQKGLITVLWMYPRGKDVPNENDIHLIAGGAGVATCLGADFVKLNYPYRQKGNTAEKFKEVVNAAGDRTGVICIGGQKKEAKKFLNTVHQQVNISKTKGIAVGRNIYQRPLEEAVRIANAITGITLYNYSVEDAYSIYKGEKELKL